VRIVPPITCVQGGHWPQGGRSASLRGHPEYNNCISFFNYFFHFSIRMKQFDETRMYM
jgi:hypothetical protein